MHNNPKSTKKFRKAPLIFSIIFLIFSCAVFFFLYKKTEGNKAVAEDAQTKWQNEATRRDEIRSLGRSLKDIENERNLLESHFAYGSDIVPFLDTIEKLATEVNAKPEIVSVDIPKNKKGLYAVVKASGSFESIYKYLTLLENSPYELEFTSANIQNLSTGDPAAQNSTSGWEAVFKIQLLSFIQ